MIGKFCQLQILKIVAVHEVKLCLLVSSAVNLCKQFGPRPDFDPNRLTLTKKLQKVDADHKKARKITSRLRVN